MKQVLFFALEDDLLPVLEAVERVGPLKYVRMGQSLKSEYESFTHCTEIPNLGKASSDSASTCESFLVTESPMSVNVRAVKAATGFQLYYVDQLVNPDSVTLTPAGVRGQNVVLYGRVATAAESPISQKLMKRFDSAFKKYFKKVKAFWIGPQALGLLYAGNRLTISIQSPRDFDLTVNT